MLSDLQAVEGDWLVALQQDEGKGRQGRSWETIEGNFFGSTLIQLRPSDPAPPTLALAAGLALIEAVEGVAPAAPLMLKWPNDLMLEDGKLAGVLLERSGDRVVAGFGVNLACAPGIPGRKTAALKPFGDVTPQAFAQLLAEKFSELLAAWRMSEPARFAAAWETRAHPRGTVVQVHGGQGERVCGAFDGIEPDGAMRLRHDDAVVELIRAGDVTLT